jgi:REP element-mobilizing transposase RayT
VCALVIGMGWPQRRRIRLREDVYEHAGSTWLVSFATQDRQAAFREPSFAGIVAATFELRAEAMDVGLDLYCLMPDHAHLLVEVRSTGLLDYIRDVKSRTTRDWWAEGGQGRLWQRSFHDHGLRTPHDYEAAATYILNNPVEAGLAESWEDYPLIGGTSITRTPRS